MAYKVLKEDNSFEVVFADPLPGIVPYFLTFSIKDCKDDDQRRRLPQGDVDQANRMAMIYVINNQQGDFQSNHYDINMGR